MINRFYVNIKIYSFFKNLLNNKFNFYNLIYRYYKKKNFLYFSKGRIALYNILNNEISNKKKEVIISPFTLPVIINIIKFAGGKPVFVDLDLFSGLPKISELKKKISDKTSLIIITHLYSQKKNLKQFNNLKKKIQH